MIEKAKVIGIAGGSGSGKSTLAVALCKKYPESITLLHIDDYFKKKEELSFYNDLPNWDNPHAIKFDDLYKDVTALMNGHSITILTKSELYHPEYNHAIKNKLEYTILPKPLIIIEGYLALSDERIRNLMDLKVYLDIPIEESTKRRSANKFALDGVYYEKVLVPMHNEFVIPTKKYADLIINVSTKTKEEIFSLTEEKIKEFTK